MKLKFISFLFFNALVFTGGYVNAQSLDTVAKQAIVIDYDTNTVLFEKNADERMPTSSMSKVMSMYLVFDALKKGNLSLNDTFLVSEKAWRKGGSKMFVELGKQIKVEDLIRGVVIQSGNDATIVLAEGLAGSESAFASALNKKAQNLGMNNSNFMNASGWPDLDHYSTARDLAVLARATIENFPEYYKYYAEPEFTYHDIKQSNRNPLLSKKIGADGLKTGHTEDGGYGLIGTGKKNGRRVIIVLNGMESSKMRASESVRILQWGLNSFKTIALFENNSALGKVPVYLGSKTNVKVKATSASKILVPKLMGNDIKIEMEYSSPLKAPIMAGQDVGVIKVYMPNSDEVLETRLVAMEAVDEMNGIMRLITNARLLTTGQGHFVYD